MNDIEAPSSWDIINSMMDHFSFVTVCLLLIIPVVKSDYPPVRALIGSDVTLEWTEVRGIYNQTEYRNKTIIWEQTKDSENKIYMVLKKTGEVERNKKLVPNNGSHQVVVLDKSKQRIGLVFYAVTQDDAATYILRENRTIELLVYAVSDLRVTVRAPNETASVEFENDNPLYLHTKQTKLPITLNLEKTAPESAKVTSSRIFRNGLRETTDLQCTQPGSIWLNRTCRIQMDLSPGDYQTTELMLDYLVEGTKPIILMVVTTPAVDSVITTDKQVVIGVSVGVFLAVIAVIIGVVLCRKKTAGDLIAAAEAGDCRRVFALLQQGVDINGVDVDGNTALGRAAESGKLEVVEQLLAHEAGIERGYWKPLSLAARGGQIDIIKCLLRSGADINAESDGCTALVVAAERGELEIVKLLLSLGADTERGKSKPLSLAAFGGHVDTVQCLLQHGEDINAEDGYGDTALGRAAGSGKLEVVKLLLSKGADTERGREMKPLVWAARKRQIDIIQCLLQHGASQEAKNEALTTVLKKVQVVTRRYFDGDERITGLKPVIEILRSHGAVANDDDDDDDDSYDEDNDEDDE